MITRLENSAKFCMSNAIFERKQQDLSQRSQHHSMKSRKTSIKMIYQIDGHASLSIAVTICVLFALHHLLEPCGAIHINSQQSQNLHLQLHHKSRK